MEPPVAVPLNVAVVSFVMLSDDDVPVSLAESRSGVEVVASVYETISCPAWP